VLFRAVPDFCRIQSSTVVLNTAICNERPRRGYRKINNIQFAGESSNQVVGGSSPSGRAKFSGSIPEKGTVVELPRIGVLHHKYLRMAA